MKISCVERLGSLYVKTVPREPYQKSSCMYGWCSHSNWMLLQRPGFCDFWLPWKEKVSRTDSINSFFSEGKGITIHRLLSTILYHMLPKKTTLLLIYMNTSHWGKPKGGNNFVDNMQHAFYTYSKLLFWNYVYTKRQRWHSRSIGGFKSLEVYEFPL